MTTLPSPFSQLPKTAEFLQGDVLPWRFRASQHFESIERLSAVIAMAILVITGYKWDYAFYKWGYKYF